MADIKLGTYTISGVKVGSNNAQKLMVGNTQIWPQSGGGYYDCGYGCQFYTYNPGCPVCGIYSIFISNMSYDLVVESITINGTGIYGVSFPIYTSTSNGGTTNESGTLQVRLYVSGTSTTQNISILDSNSNTQCQDFTGRGYYVFDNVYVSSSGIGIYINNGNCY